MKKTRLVWLVALLLVTAMILSSCGSVSSVTKLIREDYDPSADIFTSEAIVSELAGYTFVDANGEFALFENETGTALSRKIFSFRAEKVILTLASTTYDYDLDFVTDETILPVFIVAETPIEASAAPLADEEYGNGEQPPVPEESASEDTKYTLYDAQGNVVKTVDYETKAPYEFVKDVIIYDDAAYAVSKDGTLTKEVDVPEYIELDGRCYQYNDDYYYIYDEDGVVVYDHSFNYVSSWYAPGYVDEISYNFLNNGDILVQYMYQVDEDAKKFDLTFVDEGYPMKVDLVSLVVSAEKGSSKEVELDYIVNFSVSNARMNESDSEEDVIYTDSFENIAVLSPIVNKLIDESDAAQKIVFLTNNGKIAKEIKFVDNQGSNLPFKLADDRYLMSTLAGYVILNDKGDVVKSFNNYLASCGTYFYGDKAIYDLDLNVVYNLVENDAEIIDIVGDTIFVQAKTDDTVTTIAFCNGTQKTVHTETETTETYFEIFGGIGYVIVDSASGDHKYYNTEGTLIVTTSYELDIVATSDKGDVVILCGQNGESKTYHVFTVAK